MTNHLKIGFAGAGAVGCHYGSKLAKAGHDIRLLARGEHLHALKQNGLLHESDGHTSRIQIPASDDPSTLGICDIVLLSCKMNALRPTLDQLKPHMPETVLIITLQNGVEAPDIVARQFPNHAIAAATAFIGARMQAPGHIIHSAAGGMRLGQWQQGPGSSLLEQLADAFNDASVPTGIDNDTGAMLWRKLLWNTGFNAITAITRRFARDMAAAGETEAIVETAMIETVNVAQAIGIDINRADADKMIQATLTMGPIKTSMWQDIEAGRPTEIDYLNGAVVRFGEAHQVDTPVNRILCALVHAIEGNSGRNDFIPY